MKKINLSFLSLLVFGMLFVSSTAYAATPIVQSAKITGPNTVVIVYSESINTTLNDYGNFTGALSGMSLSGISGSGTNVITLTLSGGTLSASATGGLNINNTVTAISDGSQIGGGPYNVTDGQAPLLSSFGMTSSLTNGTFARAGDTLTVTFNTNESIYGSPTVTIDNETVTASGSGSGPYTASYTLSTSDTPDTVPVSMQFTDIAGNVGYGSFILGGGTGPRIVSITSDANTTGSLIPGNTINFVLTLSTPAPGAFVSGSYDSVPLSWTTQNGGATYIATYTVQNGNTSTYSPLQISGVTVRDASGNISLPASGSDIQRTINAQSFSITETAAVPSPSTTNTPKYEFYSSQDGTITFGGSCSSTNLSAATGYNFITFNPLPNGTYSNCTVTVTDAAGYASNTLTLSPFTVQMDSNPTTTLTTPASTGTSTSLQSTISSLTAQIQAAQAQLAALNGGTTTTTTSTSYKFYNPLKLGSTGADVTALQQRLASEGIYSGPVTGYYGALTEAAVKKYQGLHSLQQLGNVGPGTRADLNSGL
jgi:hypothetical protein